MEHSYDNIPSPQEEPQDLSASRMRSRSSSISDVDPTTSDSDSMGSSVPMKRPRFYEDNNNIEGYDLSSKREFLASLELATSPETEEEQDPFLEDFKKMKSKGEFTCRLCTMLFPNLRALKSHNRVHLEGPNFECNLCPYRSFERSLVLRHMRTHNGERPYECPVCKYAFTTKANCERHMRNRHTKEASTQMDLPIDLSVKKPVYPFLTIPYFIHPPILYQNLQKDLFRGLQLTGGRILEKKEEVKMVVKNGLLVPKQKQRRYRTERPFGCDHCAARFTLRSNMERHVKQQHPEFWSQRQRSGGRKSREPKTESREIPKGVKEAIVEQIKLKNEEKKEAGDLASVSKMLDNASSQDFREYFDRTEDDPGEDSEEGLVAATSEDASSEERGSPEARDGKEKKRSAYSLAPNRVSCPYCSREFPWTSSLRRHVLTHTGQKPYKCPACPLLFTTKSNCDRHLGRKHGAKQEERSRKREEKEEPVAQDTSVTEMPFKCHLCESAFRERQDALEHLKAIHRKEYDALVAKGALDSCSETEENESISKDHSNRKVICAFCLRRFWSAEDLRRHMRTHTGERPFSCDLCSRRFTLKHSMLRHKKKHGSPGIIVPPAETEEFQGSPKSDLISNLLGIKDASLVETMLASTATDAAKILGIDKNNLKN
ncbi:ras-responsive element-binding protein 1-like [Cimex lectularius]|uniref:C2H2-type domain-containing protein n=1 Tax=Cimex lectularius TaxID=79782 RepID=A0A8I6RAZ3_CIMLE|nr:ras-responsive element-binding protein 1-like [Cimex lectularius]